jgi:flagellar hook assembly protein FlgD
MNFCLAAARLALEVASAITTATTRISYSVPTSQHVRIAIYDVAGRLVEDLVNETKAAGEYVVEWDAGSLASGIYFYRLRAGNTTLTKKMVFLK